MGPPIHVSEFVHTRPWSQSDVALHGLNTAVASPEFYKEAPDAITGALARVDELKDSLLRAYARWDELDSRRR